MFVPRSVSLGIVGMFWLLQLNDLTLVQGASTQQLNDRSLVEPLESALDEAAILKEGVLAGFTNITNELIDKAQNKLHPSSTPQASTITLTTTTQPSVSTTPANTPSTIPSTAASNTSTTPPSTTKTTTPSTPPPTTKAATPSAPPSTTPLPPSTPPLTTPPAIPPSSTLLPSTSPAPCLGPVSDGTCIDPTTGSNLTTSINLCTNSTGFCAATDVGTVCTASCGGACLPTNISYLQCSQYNGCASPPEKIMFNNLPASLSSLPPPTAFSLQGLNFTVTSTAGTSSIAATSVPIYVSSPPTAVLATFNYDPIEQVIVGTLQIQDLNVAAGGAFVAISAYLSTSANVNSLGYHPVSGSLNGTSNPLCQVSISSGGPFDGYGPATLSLNGEGRSCIVDTLSIPLYASGPTVIDVSLDDFVVCKANQLSGLLPT